MWGVFGRVERERRGGGGEFINKYWKRGGGWMSTWEGDVRVRGMGTAELWVLTSHDTDNIYLYLYINKE